MANYEIWLTDDFGARLAPLDNFITLEASKLVNRIASFTMRVPLSFDENLIAPDRMIQVWREPTGGKLKLWNVYFLRRWVFETQGAQEMVTLAGPDINDLLRRRHVIAYAASSQASKTDFADDMMKAVVTQSLADGVAPTPDAGSRVWADLSVQADLSLGPTITKSFPFDKLLTTGGQGVLDVLSRASKEAGNEVFFEIAPNVVSSNSINFQFRTYINQPGQDVSSQVTFDQAAGNMRDASLEYDYTDEENYIYGGGQGQEDQRNVQQVSDSDRYLVSQWARCEGFADARNQKTNNGVRESARSKLNEGRPRIRFTATPVDTKGTRFGIDWDWGYLVGTKEKNLQFDSIIRAVTLAVNDTGADLIGARLDFEALL